MKKIIVIYLPMFLIMALFISISVGFEMWRWHAFQTLTHNKIGFWEYVFLFGGRR